MKLKCVLNDIVRDNEKFLQVITMNYRLPIPNGLTVLRFLRRRPFLFFPARKRAGPFHFDATKKFPLEPWKKII